MTMLNRFRDIMSSNINALLDRVEDPEKMIDQYLRNLNRDLANVKSETATVMAEAQRAKRVLDDCREDIGKMENYAMKALEAANESDAKKFLERKLELAKKEEGLLAAYELAQANAEKMREMHDKLMKDIKELESKRAMLKGKLSVAKTQEKINKIGSSVADAGSSISAFERMEDKVNQALDKANAMAELNKSPKDDIEDLAAKYGDSPSSDVEDELERLKAQLKKED